MEVGYQVGITRSGVARCIRCELVANSGGLAVPAVLTHLGTKREEV